MTNTQKAPNTLISPNGQPIFGQFDGIPAKLGLQKFAYFNAMDKKASRWAKHFDYKQFQFVSVVTKQYVIGVAIADIRYLSSAFCYIYDIQNDQLTENTWLRPLGIGSTITDSPLNGTTKIANSICFNIQDESWHVTINTEAIQAEISLIPSQASLPLSMCTPTGYNGWTYTQKHNALAIEGKLAVNNISIDLNNALAGYDFSAGYMRRETSWRWASINAQVNGIRLGLNLAAGVNETGSSECALWVDGERHLLTPVHFQFDRHSPTLVWNIVSDDGSINLQFRPVNQRSEKINAVFIKSNFRQYIGHFNGTIKDNTGKSHHLDAVLGLTEDHFAKW
ncbi:DUF2804 domain-containing protein [Vibrio amylolyticus]|uniref:DUF2804 domain-containing protein n=1 Tax=Vibrio amylolyticus TaxID=2847292 RepID=UPI00354D757C